MSKKRLSFDVEREMEHLKKIVNKDDSLTITSRFVKYLIEQVERVQELEKFSETLLADAESLAKENKRYRDALIQISKRPTFMTEDMHSNRTLKISRKALRGDSNG